MKRLLIKVIRDLFQDKFRAVLSLMAMIIGMTSFGVILFSYNTISREIVNVFASINPSSADVVVDRIDEKLISLTKEFKGISDFEEKAFYELRMKVGENEWKTLHLFAVKDFEQMKINKVSSLEGSFRPGKNEVLIERDALGVGKISLGQTISISFPDSSLREFKVTGIVNDIALHPASIHNTVYAYVSYETLADLGLKGNRLDFIASGNKFDRSNILSAGNDYMKLLEKNGYVLKSFNVMGKPGRSPHLDEYDSILLILQIFSIAAFLFGCTIISSLLSTILSNQIRQIGVLKAIGGKTGNIFTVYMLSISVLILVAVAISLPLSLFASQKLSILLMRLGNMQLPDGTIPGSLILVFCVLGIVVPVLVAFFPIRRGISTTVKEAINDYGVQQSGKISTGFSCWSNNIKLFSRPILLSIRNAVRRKGRFYLNMATLTLGGVLFVAVITSMMSIQYTVSKDMERIKYDYQMSINAGTREDKIKDAISDIPEVLNYEIWGRTGGKLVYRDGQVGNLYPIMAPSFDTKVFMPEVLEGRWLQEGDTNEIVVGYRFLGAEQEYKLGDILSFKIGNATVEFRIVGTIKEYGSPAIYLNRKGYEQFVQEDIRMSSIKLMTQSGNTRRSTIYHKIEHELAEHGITVLQSESKTDQYWILLGHFMVIITTFAIVSIMVVIVAAFGLTSTMSIQVFERTREIGIMKAMGASPKQIRRIVTAESVFIAVSSWIASIVIGIPTGALGAYVMGNLTIRMPLNINYSSFFSSCVFWLVLILMIGYYASRTASKRASKMCIKETLAFE
ncbi:MAG: FtsX-like permease family protein [Clostridia bacterium]|nr:FtsX-like permease family protein [Clostridia bacterium]